MNTSDAIKVVVEKLVGQNQWFTAFDITKILRHGGIRVHHHVVSMEVRVLYSNHVMGDFRRTCVDVGTPIQPLLYHPDGSEPSGYDKDWLTPTELDMLDVPALLDSDSPPPVPTTPLQHVAPLIPAPAPFIGHISKILSPTASGRLHIPVNYVKYAGFTPQDILTVGVRASDHVIVLEKCTSNTVSGKSRISVNKDGRIRLSKRHLARIANNSGYTIRHMGQLAPNALEVVAE